MRQVWPYGIRLDLHHGSAVILRSDTLLHGTAPVVLPDGRPSGRSGGGRSSGDDSSSSGGGGGGGGGNSSGEGGGVASCNGATPPAGGGRQLVGVALVSKVDVTRAAVNQICDREITWQEIP